MQALQDVELFRQRALLAEHRAIEVERTASEAWERALERERVHMAQAQQQRGAADAHPPPGSASVAAGRSLGSEAAPFP